MTPFEGAAAPPRRWILGGVAVAVLALLIATLAFMVRPQHRQLGGNSAAATSLLQVGAPDRLCVDGLAVPRGTGEVRLWLAPTSPQPVLVDGSLALRGGPSIPLRSTPLHAGAGFMPVALQAVVRRDAVGRICLTRSRGVATIQYGVAGGLSGARASLNGKDLAGTEPAVRFFPPAGARERGFAQIGPALQRMSRLSPSGLPAGALAVLLFAGLPLLLAILLHTLVGAPSLSARRIAVRCTLAAAGLCGVWAIITPPFQGPDETEHYAFLQYVAETGKHPEPAKRGTQPPFSSQEAAALDALRHYQVISEVPGRLPWDPATAKRWRDVDGLPAGDGGGYTESASGHSALYYVLITPGYWAGKLVGGFPGSLLGARLATTGMAGLLAGLAVWLASLLAPGRRRFAALAGLIVATIPMASHVGASINNDALVNRLAAAAIVTAAALLRGRLTLRWLLAAGALGVLVPVAKVTGLAAAAGLALCVVVAAARYGCLRSPVPGSS